MKIKRCILFIHENHVREKIEQYLHGFAHLILIQHATSWEEVESSILTGEIHFCIIQFEGNEIDFFRTFSNKSYYPPTLIHSNQKENALLCFEFPFILDYLYQEFSQDRFFKALHKVLNFVNRPTLDLENATIFFKMGRVANRFVLKSIDFIEAFGIYSKISCQGKILIVNEKISQIENRLSPDYFIRLHKSYIINLGNLTSLDKRNVYIGDFSIPIGKKYKHNLVGLLKLLEK